MALFAHRTPPYDPQSPPTLPSASRARPGRQIAATSAATLASASTSTVAVPAPTLPTPPSAVEKRLLFNFMYARFIASPLVSTAGTQSMVFTDRFGAASEASLQIDHIYRIGLDLVPPDRCSLTERGTGASLMRMPRSLVSNEWPAWMEPKSTERNARAIAAGKPAPITISKVSSRTLLSKLWHAPEQLLQSSGAMEVPDFHLDTQLTRDTWQRTRDPRSGLEPRGSNSARPLTCSRP